MKIRVADYLAELLAQNNIKDIFTVTGGGAMHLNDAFGKNKKLKCYYNHHEQACAIAAEGYARINNQIAAVCVTTGPGGTNTITGVVGAYYDSIPMLVISGQVKYSTTVVSCPEIPLRQLGDQECNINQIVKSITKYSTMVIEPEMIKYEFEKALFIAKNGRPGPVWLDIPLNVQGAIIETDNLQSFDHKELSNILPPKVKDKDIALIVELMKKAKKPVVMVGTGVRIAGAQGQLLKFIKASNIPVVTAFNAYDLVEDNNPLYAGRPGTVGERAGNFVVQKSDLLLVIGCRLNIRQISYNYENFAKNAVRIMVDIDKAEMDKPTLNIDHKIHADALDFLTQLNKQNIRNNNKEWIDYCQLVRKTFDVVDKEYYAKNQPLNPYVFARELALKLPENVTSVCSNASACVITFQTAIIKHGQRLFSNSGIASMGYGLPASIGACVANGNKSTICMEGDGSLQMNIQEFMTISQNHLNIKTFVYNNGGYHSIRQTQRNFFGTPLVGVGVDSGDLAFPHLEYIAKAYGLKYYLIDSQQKLTLIPDILQESGACIVNVIVDPEQAFAPKLSSKKLPDGTMVSASLEDMYPFLDEEIFNKFNKI